MSQMGVFILMAVTIKRKEREKEKERKRKEKLEKKKKKAFLYYKLLSHLNKRSIAQAVSVCSYIKFYRDKYRQDIISAQ